MSIFVMVEDGGDGTLTALYTHGHQEPAAFVASVLTEMDATIQPADVRHVWLRMIPDKRGGMHIREYEYGNGRGSFPATVADWGS